MAKTKKPIYLIPSGPYRGLMLEECPRYYLQFIQRLGDPVDGGEGSEFYMQACQFLRGQDQKDEPKKRKTPKMKRAKIPYKKAGPKLSVGKFKNRQLKDVPLYYLKWYYENVIEDDDVRRAVAEQLGIEHAPIVLSVQPKTAEQMMIGVQF